MITILLSFLLTSLLTLNLIIKSFKNSKLYGILHMVSLLILMTALYLILRNVVIPIWLLLLVYSMLLGMLGYDYGKYTLGKKIKKELDENDISISHPIRKIIEG